MTMNKQLAPAIAIVAALLAGAAMPAAAEAPSGQQDSETYNWLHPKRGIVKVDRATGAIVGSQRAAGEQTAANDPAAQARYWLDPKGNIRVIKTPAGNVPQSLAAQARP
jgi:hypothetical protein